MTTGESITGESITGESITGESITGESILVRLAAVIEDRKINRPADSYTMRLLDGGVDAIGAKVREEADELVEAAKAVDQDIHAVAHEAADLIYHMLVMLAHCNVELAAVEDELAKRFGTSGLKEKETRGER